MQVHMTLHMFSFIWYAMYELPGSVCPCMSDRPLGEPLEMLSQIASSGRCLRMKWHTSLAELLLAVPPAGEGTEGSRLYLEG